MGWTCVNDGCFNPVENQDTGLCASCSAAIRKSERQSKKFQVVKQPNKVSEKRMKQLNEYTEVREMFLNMEPNHFCQVDGCRNQATEIHHAKGKEGVLLLDTVYFLAVCRTCHERITRDSNWAILNGYSEKRTV